MYGMHTTSRVYNNYLQVYDCMNQKQTQIPTEQELSSYFPRIIREFNDGPDEKPALYGGE